MIALAISSAPIWPSLASFSESIVNPEMSANTRVPSTHRWLRSGSVPSHSCVSRGI